MGGGVKNCQNLRDVIYGQSLNGSLKCFVTGQGITSVKIFGLTLAR